MRRRSLLTSNFDPTTGRGVYAGYEVVDLGLPSGTLWATCNVGASTETEIGNKYKAGAGDTSGSEGTSFNEYYYAEPFPAEKDTATQVMGNLFCTPSYEQFEELLSYTLYDSSTGRYCVPGTEKYICLPRDTGTSGSPVNYWTSSFAPYSTSATNEISNQSGYCFSTTGSGSSVTIARSYKTNLKCIRAVVNFRKVWDIDYTYSQQKKTITLAPGVYAIQCWGGLGGTTKLADGSVIKTGGKGGFVSGVITIANNVTVYAYPAKAGEGSARKKGKFVGGSVGGGNASVYYYTRQDVGSGGGASDVRIGSDSLYARVIVAGGGGGAGSSYAGGKADFDAANSPYGGKKGTLTDGGVSYQNKGYEGSFGIGGGGFYDDGYGSNLTYGCSGGGGGWYGGSSGIRYSGNVNDSSGGGGSSYIYNSSTAGYYPSGCLLDSQYYMKRCFMHSTSTANQNTPSTDGELEDGHSGNGHVRITKIL